MHRMAEERGYVSYTEHGPMHCYPPFQVNNPKKKGQRNSIFK